MTLAISTALILFSSHPLRIFTVTGTGTLSTTLGVPGRYIHSPATMIDLDDLKAVKEIAKKIIETFDSEKLKEILK